jgi:putative FmdB family regulatory protein
MPIYGYRCSECGHELEVRQSMSDEPLKVCGDCGGQLRKLLYPVGVQFKGSGFYSTDYKNGGKSESKDGASGESGSSSEGGKSESGKSESTTSEKSSSSEKKSESVASKE